MADEDFKQQLELEALESQKSATTSDPYTYTDPNDGTVYEWKQAQNAWFPKIDDDFIASYQSNYQYQEETKEVPTTTNSEVDNKSEEANNKGEKRKANDPCWFQVDDAHNTNVYVSGLPTDTTEEEFIELMSKCGLIMKDPDNMKYKIKLYKNNDGTFKGDARCCYIKIESVGLALDILDGYLFKNKTVHVERAQFQLKGNYDPTKKPKKKKNKDKEKLKKRLEKLFDWRPDKLRGMRSRNENTVVLKNMFDPKDFEADATLILEYQKDLREECSKCGDVKKVVVYDRNPEGVATVTFAEAEMADECISLMHNRWFSARQLTAETWDGKTKYKIVETDEEKAKRMKEWENYLQDKHNDEKLQQQTASQLQNEGNSKQQQQTVSHLQNAGNSKQPDEQPQSDWTTYADAQATDSSGNSDDENEKTDMA